MDGISRYWSFSNPKLIQRGSEAVLCPISEAISDCNDTLKASSQIITDGGVERI
ncbi:hypothetical protein GV827_18375 [Sulfitobacter sp. JBTF-M27]|uniref:Uncharacterized protein n=1 Tax=Sulfitobacter sediminilitoris TaxID=2698830 RepID=A0A6P0CH26_9RHOB|nr:hypothetical protein [Sulfitobacter sediminilitoris]NEK24355.1 hypothetical protein [Sulfitobacter sediminilitoris]